MGKEVRKFFYALSFLLAFGVICNGCSKTEKRQPVPLVIYIVLDTCRADHLSGYGYPLPTSPTMDEIAKEGVLFENCFSQSHVTSFAVAQYMTSRYYVKPFWERSRGSNLWLKKRPDDEVNLVQLFRDNGYYTKMISTHPWFKGSEFTEIANELDYLQNRDNSIGSADFSEINRVLFPWFDKKYKNKTFLYIHAMDSHDPHVVQGKYRKFIKGEKPPRFTKGVMVGNNGKRNDDMSGLNAQQKEYILGVYDGEVLRADDGIADLRQKLIGMGLWKKAMVIISADHGEDLGEDGTLSHTHCESDVTTHVPLIIKFPENSGVTPGIRVASMVESIDILPTIQDYLGLNMPEKAKMFGKSLQPLLEDNPPPSGFRNKVFNVSIYDFEGSSRTLSVSTKKNRYLTGLFSKVFPDDERNNRPRLYKRIDGSAEQINLPLQQQSNRKIAQSLSEELKELEAYRSAFARQPVKVDRAFSRDISGVTVVAGDVSESPLADQLDKRKWHLQPFSLTAKPADEQFSVKVSIMIPDHEYNVFAVVGHDDTGGQKQSHFRFRAMSENRFKLLKTSSSVSSREQRIVLGRYEINNGEFFCEFGNVKHYGVKILKFVFSPVELKSIKGREVKDKISVLRELGYAK